MRKKNKKLPRVNQKNKIDEIILIDGNSKDKTIQIAKKYTKNFYFKKKVLLMIVNLGLTELKIN